jgi:hypothetical protein
MSIQIDPMSIQIDPNRTPDRPKRPKTRKGVQSKSVPTAFRHSCIPATAPCADSKLPQSRIFGMFGNSPAWGEQEQVGRFSGTTNPHSILRDSGHSIIYKSVFCSERRPGTTPEVFRTLPQVMSVRSSQKIGSQLRRFSRRAAMLFT